MIDSYIYILSSHLLGTNMAIDLKWLQKNMKSSKTNIERK